MSAKLFRSSKYGDIKQDELKKNDAGDKEGVLLSELSVGINAWVDSQTARNRNFVHLGTMVVPDGRHGSAEFRYLATVTYTTRAEM
jgi:hypothetical protein